MAKEKIETLAVLDYLTLLPNRSGLYSFYSGLSIQEYVTAMFLDIDNFKRVNDTYGHQVGDELLKAVTKICRRSCRMPILHGLVETNS